MCTYYLDSYKNGLIFKKKTLPEVTKMWVWIKMGRGKKVLTADLNAIKTNLRALNFETEKK